MGAIECLTSVPEKWDGTTISGDDQMSRHAARQASSAAACNMITITGIGDHDRLEWLITMNGIRTGYLVGGIAEINAAVTSP
jgi:hypothetical protein